MKLNTWKERVKINGSKRLGKKLQAPNILGHSYYYKIFIFIYFKFTTEGTKDRQTMCSFPNITIFLPSQKSSARFDRYTSIIGARSPDISITTFARIGFTIHRAYPWSVLIVVTISFLAFVATICPNFIFRTISRFNWTFGQSCTIGWSRIC